MGFYLNIKPIVYTVDEIWYSIGIRKQKYSGPSICRVQAPLLLDKQKVKTATESNGKYRPLSFRNLDSYPTNRPAGQPSRPVPHALFGYVYALCKLMIYFPSQVYESYTAKT